MLLSRLTFSKEEELVCCVVGRFVLCWDFVHPPCLASLGGALGWTWKLTGTSLDLHEDSVVRLLFLLTLGA